MTYRFKEFALDADTAVDLITKLNGVVAAMHRIGYEIVDIGLSSPIGRYHMGLKFRQEVDVA